MIENFITSIYVENSRNVKHLDIPLSSEKRQHLILTGKNGSGKTSLLLEIKRFLVAVVDGSLSQFSMYLNTQKYNLEQIKLVNNSRDRIRIKEDIERNDNWFLKFGGTRLTFPDGGSDIYTKYLEGQFLFVFFDSKRQTSLTIPQGINAVNLQKKYESYERANNNFLQYIVNLKADRSFAKDDNENEVVAKIDHWFERLENRLKYIFDVDSLELRFDRKTYNFEIITNQAEPFGFNNLSDGYSSIISIVTELLLRMEAHEVKAYDLEGIVIIDEIETHLHVDLQKKILPFLTDFFPKIQFIVSTHSPFVLSSISNATICDLETRTVINDLSAYSYDALVESYFETDKYSEQVKIKVEAYENLISLKEKTPEQRDQIKVLRNYFAHAPKYLSSELMAKLQEIELMELLNNKK